MRDDATMAQTRATKVMVALVALVILNPIAITEI
jgi:hypothetical protein